MSEEDKVDKYDYLQGKYVFRYPFTFKAIKWGGIIGSFFGLHSFIKHRSARGSFNAFVWGTVFSGFAIWSFFMAKNSFYQDQIKEYELEEHHKVLEMDAFKHLVAYKLQLPPDHDLSDDELMKKYEDYLETSFHRNSRLDQYLVGVTASSFDKSLI